MAPIRYANSEFDRQRQSWIRMAEFDGDLDGFSTYLNQLGEFAAGEIKKTLPEIRNSLGATSQKPGAFKVGIYQGRDLNFISLAKAADPFTLRMVMLANSKGAGRIRGCACRREGVSGKARGSGPRRPPRRGPQLPRAGRQGLHVEGALLHPLQVLENAYQRVVRKAGQEAESDPVKAQSEALAELLHPGPAEQPGLLQVQAARPVRRPATCIGQDEPPDRNVLPVPPARQLSAWRRTKSIAKTCAAELSGDLTKLLHNGDRAKMAWLAGLADEEDRQLGTKINALNQDAPAARACSSSRAGARSTISSARPRRARTTGTRRSSSTRILPPKSGTSVFADVHDVLLPALEGLQDRSSRNSCRTNAPQFAKYLDDSAGPQEVGDDEEIDENESATSTASTNRPTARPS